MSASASLGDVAPTHSFDEGKLQAYLKDHIDGVASSFQIHQFRGGQSNPTFLIEATDHKYVLRMKPLGKLLPSAHQVEREYWAIKSLYDTNVPVPTARLLCEDSSIIGTPFYVMDYVEGRVIEQPVLHEVEKDQREPIYKALAETLAHLHQVNWRAVGLEDFGRHHGYVDRQIKRWTKQYESARTHTIPAMDKLMAWLPEHLPEEEPTCIAHGDFRLGNVMLHPQRPEVVAVLDWELSTLGSPLADLAYCCLPYHLPKTEPSLRGLVGYDLAAEGIPSEETFIETYCHHTGRRGVPDLNFFLAFSLFRLASIRQGIYFRALQGNAADEGALEFGKRAEVLAETGWRLIQQNGQR